MESSEQNYYQKNPGMILYFLFTPGIIINFKLTHFNIIFIGKHIQMIKNHDLQNKIEKWSKFISDEWIDEYNYNAKYLTSKSSFLKLKDRFFANKSIFCLLS